MKSFIKWAVRHWKCVAGMAISMAGVYIATTGEYETGMYDVSEMHDAVNAQAKRLGRELSDNEVENAYNQWIKKTYK